RRSLSPRTCFTFTPSTPPPISTLSLHDALPIFYQRFRLIGIRLSKLIERDGAKCRITNIGRDRRGNGEGTHRPGNESARSRLFSNALRRAAGNLRRRKVYLTHKLAKIDIVHHVLKKFLILPSAHRLTLKQKV